MAQEIADSTLLDTWGSGGNIVEPDISKIIEGWQLGEQPPHEYMNWLQNTFGSKLNHILKNGVASWNNETEYLAGSILQHNGNVWLCKTTNTNSEPTDANSNWKRIITVESLTTVLSGYVALTGNQTINGIKTFTDRPLFLSPNSGTTGAIGLFDAEGNPDAVFIQALNNERSVQYGFLKFNKNGTITPSGNIVGNITGNAATATKLATARTINGVSFDGSENISIGLDAQGGLYSSNFVLNNTHKNKLLVCSGTINISLPTVSTIRSGDLFIINNTGTGNITLVANGNSTNLSRLTILPGEVLILQSDGGSFYRLVSRSKDFASSMNVNAGYTYLPNGMLMQWGRSSTNIAPGGTLNITFPITFPTDIFYSNVAVLSASTNNQLTNPFVMATTVSNLAVANTDVDSTITQIRWFAIGY